jgi:hypothetical protein
MTTYTVGRPPVGGPDQPDDGAAVARADRTDDCRAACVPRRGRPVGFKRLDRVSRPRYGGPPDRAAPFRRDRGSVTVELAVALPVLVLLISVGLGAVSAMYTKLRCANAARDVALAQARGAHGADEAGHTAPAGASVEVWVKDGEVQAVVSADAGLLGRLLNITVSASAVAAVEPGVP